MTGGATDAVVVGAELATAATLTAALATTGGGTGADADAVADAAGGVSALVTPDGAPLLLPVVCLPIVTL